MGERFIRSDTIVGWFLFCLVFVMSALVVSHIGAAWDEPDNIYSGGVYLNFFRQGWNHEIFTDTQESQSYFGGKIFSQDRHIARYPPVPNYIGSLIALIFERLGKTEDTDIIASFHLASALFFAMLVAYVYRWCREFHLSTYVSITVALLVALYPTVMGHGLSTLKDSAQVSLFTVSLYYLYRGTKRLGALSHEENAKNDSVISYFDIVIGALCWGLGLATKFNAVYVPCIWLLWICSTIIYTGVTLGKGWGWSLTRLQRIVRISFIIGLVGLLCAFAVWPYLWTDPIRRTIEVIRYFTTVGEGYTVLWNGQTYTAGGGQSLWWYPLVNLVSITPIPLLFFILSGCIAGIATRRYRMPFFFLIIWCIVPLIRAIFPYSAFYDGIRHFMEILPPMIIISGFGLQLLYERVRLLGQTICLFLVAVCSGLSLAVFPYGASYMNAFFVDAKGRYDRDIEALSIKEAIDTLHGEFSSLRLYVPIAGHLSWYHVTIGDLYVYNPESADTIVLVNKPSHIGYEEFLERIDGLSYQEIGSVQRGSIVLAWIFRKL